METPRKNCPPPPLHCDATASKYGFSVFTEIKSMKGERLLGIDDEMRVCLTMTEPRFDLVVLKNKHNDRIKVCKIKFSK